MEREMFANDILDKGLVSKIYKELTKLNIQNNETGPLSYTIQKNKFKMDERSKCEIGNNQNLRGEHRK